MRRAIRVLTGLALVGSWTVGSAYSNAATPEKTLKAPSHVGSASVSYTGTMPVGTQEEGIALGQIGADDPLGFCDPKNTTRNDQHTIKFVVPKIPSSLDVTAIFKISWSTPSGTADDYKLIVIGPDGNSVGEADSSSSSETAVVTDVRNGNYTAIACPYNNTNPTAKYTGTATIVVSKPNVSVAKGVKAPTYHQYYAPKSINGGAGEPSLGNNWKTGATLFQNGTETYKVAFNGLNSTWKDVSAQNTSVVTLDPILFTDNVTGRTLVSQLVLACSLSAYTDDDGANWTPSEGCGEVNGVDHQTYGGGPFPKEVAVGALPTGYKNAVYYCAQGLAFATCAVSRDGGLTFGNGNLVYTSECGGLHGHIRVGPDGAAYLPNASCSGNQGVAVSLDAGLTWNVRRVPGTIVGSSDPSVSVGKDGTVYFGVSDGSGKPLVAVSRDHGLHWSKPIDVGAAFGIHSTEFAEVVAGDGDRAAFAFLGTPTKGYFQGSKFGLSKDGSYYTGAAWHLYVATTYDRGRTWTTVDATPKDPVQRGCIWNGGGSNTCRNLLDFNDITIDKTGRVLIALADGCSGLRSDCPTSTDKSENKHEDQGAIIRQVSGKGLFAKYDAVLAKTAVKGTSSAVGTVPAVNSPAKDLAAPPAAAATGPSQLDATPTSATGTADEHKGFSVPVWVAGLGIIALLSGLLPRRRFRKAAVEAPTEE